VYEHKSCHTPALTEIGAAGVTGKAGSVLPPWDREEARRMLGFLATPGPGGLTPRETFERRQQILRDALEKMEALRLPNVLDESFWDALRGSMLAAGAVDADLDALATYYVCLTVESTKPDSDERERQLDLIGRHFCRTDMNIRIGKDDSFIRIEFPDRQRIH
jgi:hypothetical protein